MANYGESALFKWSLFIGVFLILIYLVLALISFNELRQDKKPSKGESNFMLGATVLVFLIAFGIFIYVLVKLFTKPHQRKAIKERLLSQEKGSGLELRTSSSIPAAE